MWGMMSSGQPFGLVVNCTFVPISRYILGWHRAGPPEEGSPNMMCATLPASVHSVFGCRGTCTNPPPKTSPPPYMVWIAMGTIILGDRKMTVEGPNVVRDGAGSVHADAYPIFDTGTPGSGERTLPWSGIALTGPGPSLARAPLDSQLGVRVDPIPSTGQVATTPIMAGCWTGIGCSGIKTMVVPERDHVLQSRIAEGAEGFWHLAPSPEGAKGSSRPCGASCWCGDELRDVHHHSWVSRDSRPAQRQGC